MTNRDIVIVGQQAWDVEIGSNCKNIALEFSKHNRVLYVNAPLDRITLMRHRADNKVQRRLNAIKGEEENIVAIGANIWNYYPDVMIESINWIGNKTLFNKLNHYNNKRLGKSIQKAIDALGFQNIILFNDNDIFRSFYLKDILQPDKSIYYSRDYLLAVDYWKKHGTDLEPKLIASSDICVANSTYLAEYCRQYNPHSYYVGQGCELDMFTSYHCIRKPIDVRYLESPVIGYVGALQSIRLDIELIEYIATQKPEWNIVLVGPEDDEFRLSDLHKKENIYFLGSKQTNELPAYINAFDICINPQAINAVTIGNYPRKIDEYLAMGKPVVATKTEAMSIFSEHTYLAASKDEYITLIQKAIQEDCICKRQQRKEFAAQHTWQNSVQEIYNSIQNQSL